MPLSRKSSRAEDDSDDWVSDNRSAEDTELITVPALLPVPASLARPDDSLCNTCTVLELTPRRFVVPPGDSDADSNEPDDDNIKLGPVKDIKERSPTCPFCRLVLNALSQDEVPDMEDGEAVVATMSWNTNGPNQDPEQPWNHIPQIRILRPYARKENGELIDITNLNMFPEIKLLANDAPTPSKSFFARLINDQIDFSSGAAPMVRNWLAMCHAVHGNFCNQSKSNHIGELEALISEYSGLSLKFHSDIYHAFAGITRFFKIEMQTNLYHGIPDRFFDWFLLWQP